MRAQEDNLKLNNPEQYESLKGITNLLGIDFTEYLYVNYMDETTLYSYACSSILAKLENGDIVHGRHLDYDPADALRALTFHANFKRGDELIFEGIMIAGFTGVHTAYKEGNFSISANARYPGNIT